MPRGTPRKPYVYDPARGERIRAGLNKAWAAKTPEQRKEHGRRCMAVRLNRAAIKAAVVVAVLGCACMAQNVVTPEQPTPATHALFDSYGRSALLVSTAARAADAALSCSNLSAGGHERWLPTQSCGGVVAWIAAGEVAQVGATAWLHHEGHHRVERVVPWLFTAGSLAAVGYSALARSRRQIAQP